MDTTTLPAPTTRTLKSVCPLDCPDTCSLSVDVTHDGRITRVDAATVESAANPFTGGFICKKVKGHADRVHGPDRVLTPLIRTGAKGTATFRQATWDEAIALIAIRMRQAADGPHGPASIVPFLYNSSTGNAAANSTGPALFARLGASDVHHTICAATARAAWTSVLGAMPAADPLDIEFSDCVVVWGANPTVSNTHLAPVINRAAKGNSAPLVVIDPRETGTAKRADLHLRIRPGTDVVLAMATAAELDRRNALDGQFISAHTNGFDAFLTRCREWSIARAADECGIEPAAIERFCDILSSAQRPFFRLGWGMERNRNGGSGLQAALGLRLAIGRFGTRGSGLVGSTGGRAWNAQVFMPNEQNSTRRAVNQNLLGQLLTEPGDETPIDVMFVQGANPALMNPNQAAVIQGLARDDLFTVVHDQVLTDTARWADVVLPATTHFEAADAKGSYGVHVMLTWEAVIPRVGESRTNAEVVGALAVALGLDPADFPDDPQTLIERGLADGPGTGVLRQPDESVQFRDLWPAFDDRKARFVEPTYVPIQSDLPLTLLSPASSRTINSIFGERSAAPTVHLHAMDAAARGIVDGTMVRVFNDRGSVTVPARLDGEARPGVVVITKGDWSRNFPAANGLGVNVLTTDDVDPLAGGACFNDTRVDVALAT